MENRKYIDIHDGLTITRIGYLEVSGRWKSQETHRHEDSWELIVPLSGRFWQTESNIREVNEHLIYLIPPNTEHCLVNADNEKAVLLYIMFNFSYVPFAVSQESIQKFVDSIPETYVIQKEFQQILDREGTVDESILNTKRMSILQSVSMVVQYLFLFAESTFRNSKQHSRLIADVKAYLQRNVTRKVTITELANLFYLTPNYLGTLFRNAENMSIKQCHEQLRMAYALELLRERGSELTVAQISELLGYETPQYFSRRFKQYYKMSPSQMLNEPKKEGEARQREGRNAGAEK